MNGRRKTLLLMLFVMLCFPIVFAEDCINDKNEVEPCPDFNAAEADYSDLSNIGRFFDNPPLQWDLVATKAEFWQGMSESQIKIVPAEQIKHIPLTDLANKYAQLTADQKSGLESSQISELLTNSRDIPLQVNELNPEQLIRSLKATYSQNINQLQTTNYGSDILIKNGELKTENGVLNLQKISAGLASETIISVNENGRISVNAKEIDFTTIDTGDSDFDIGLESYSDDASKISTKDANGNLVSFSVKLGKVTVQNGEMFLTEATLGIDDEEIDISSEQPVYLNSDKENALTFESVSCLESICTKPLRFIKDALRTFPQAPETQTKLTLKGNSYKVRFSDIRGDEQVIQMPQKGNAHLTIQNFETVHVYKTDSRLLISAMSVDSNLRTKFQPGSTQLIPPQVEIGTNLVHLRSAQGKTHGYLTYGNAKVLFDQYTSLAQMKKEFENQHPDLTESQRTKYLSNALGIKPEDFKQHGDAPLGLFPPDKGKWIVGSIVEKTIDGKTTIKGASMTYYDPDGKLITTSVGDVNEDGVFSLTDIDALQLKASPDGKPREGWEKLFAKGKKATAHKTVYSVGIKSGGLDSVEDSWTNAGYGSKGPYLTPGIVAIHPSNPWGYKVGDILVGDDGYVYYVADTYKPNLAKNRIDTYMSSAEGAGKYDQSLTGTSRFSKIGHESNTLNSKTTPADVRTILSKYGQFPPGESAAETIMRTNNLAAASAGSATKKNDILNSYAQIQTYNSKYNRATYSPDLENFFTATATTEKEFKSATNYAMQPIEQYYQTVASTDLMPHSSYPYNQSEIITAENSQGVVVTQ